MGLLSSLLMVPCVSGQQIAVQQPVIQNFSVGTSVSVPDRGSAHLGGVGFARSGRTVTGPFPSGSSFGQELGASSSSVQVYIHDFEAIDAELLASAPSSTHSRLDPRITKRLKQRPLLAGASSPVVAGDDNPKEAEEMALRAEARGKMSVARLHWQRAARHGSTKAAQRLAELSVKR